MTIDLDDIESRINDGIYGDDRMTDTARDDAFAALAVLLDEVERLRAEVAHLRGERAAVLACLRVADDFSPYGEIAPLILTIERGEHRREEKE